MTALLRQLTNRLVQARRQRGLTQSELAKAAHVSLKTVTNMERAIDKHDIGIQKILRVLQALGMGMELTVTEQDVHDVSKAQRTPCPTIALKDYPQLTLLAWNRADKDVIDEAEAFALYEQNWRHVDSAALTTKEQALIDKLTQQYGHGIMHV